MKTAWMAIAAGLAAGAAAAAWGAEWDARYRDAVGRALEQAAEGLKDAPLGEGARVAILPVQGDDADGWTARRLRVALHSAGKTCVEGKDDPMWMTLLETLDWEELKTGILDPDTIDQIGKLQAANVLLSGWVDPAGGRKRPESQAEVELHATEVATGKQLWAKVFRSATATSPDSPPVKEEPCPLNTGVRVFAAEGTERIAEEVGTWVEGRLVDMGYLVATGKDDDLTLTLEVESELYDRTGEWETYKGEAKATLEARGAKARMLGTATFPARGKPGIGRNGARNLAYDMEEQLGAWMKRTLDPAALDFAAVRLEFPLADSTETGGDFQIVETIRKAIEGMPSVRCAELAGQDTAAGWVAYKVTYERAAYPGGFRNAFLAAHPEIVDEYLR
jgi:hypothetical protein